MINIHINIFYKIRNIGPFIFDITKLKKMTGQNIKIRRKIISERRYMLL